MRLDGLEAVAKRGLGSRVEESEEFLEAVTIVRVIFASPMSALLTMDLSALPVPLLVSGAAVSLALSFRCIRKSVPASKAEAKELTPEDKAAQEAKAEAEAKEEATAAGAGAAGS